MSLPINLSKDIFLLMIESQITIMRFKSVNCVQNKRARFEYTNEPHTDTWLLLNLIPRRTLNFCAEQKTVNCVIYIQEASWQYARSHHKQKHVMPQLQDANNTLAHARTHADAETKQSNPSTLADFCAVAQLVSILRNSYQRFAKFLHWCVRKYAF